MTYLFHFLLCNGCMILENKVHALALPASIHRDVLYVAIVTASA